jgi:hypothetical protein
MTMYFGYALALIFSIAYFLPLNWLMNTKGIELKESSEIPDSFLLAFSNNLKSLSPEEAFLKAYQHSATNVLSTAVYALREGYGLDDALGVVKSQSEDDRILLRLVADLISFSREETPKRMSLYMEYRQEKRKCRSEMIMKLSVLSLRFRVLSCISAASMAVLAFISPVLGLFSGFQGNVYSLKLENGIKFEPCTFFALLSLCILSTYLFSKLMNGVHGGRLAIFSGFIFILVELTLVIAIGGRV